MIYEAIENPILQKFFKVDVNFDPNFEYAAIPFSNATRDEEDPQNISEIDGSFSFERGRAGIITSRNDLTPPKPDLQNRFLSNEPELDIEGNAVNGKEGGELARPLETEFEGQDPEPLLPRLESDSDRTEDQDVSDEYENLDDEEATPLKLMVKRATNVCSKIAKENSEYFELNYQVQEHQHTLSDVLE